MPWPRQLELEMGLIRELLSFGIVGIIATLSHVCTAAVLIENVHLDEFMSNACGAGIAFAVSFIGNALTTFKTNRTVKSSAARYICITLLSVVLTTAIMAFTKHQGMSTTIYAVLVMITVPPTTFLLAKFWAFSPMKK